MSDYFQRLIDRSMGRLSAIRPRLPSLYEPRHAQEGPQSLFPEKWEESEGPPLPGRIQTAEKASAAAVQERVGGHGRGAETHHEPPSDGEAASAKAPVLGTIPISGVPPSPATAVRRPGRPVLTKGATEGTSPRGNEFTGHEAETGRRHRDAGGRNGVLPQAAEPTVERTSGHDASPRKGLAPDPGVLPAEPVPLRERIRLLHDPAGPDLLPGQRKGPQTIHVRPDKTPLQALQPPPQEPTIRITIGRIDVRAVMPQPPSSGVHQKPTPPEPKVTLEEYLKKHRGGHR
jgi:hypothetical protein